MEKRSDSFRRNSTERVFSETIRRTAGDGDRVVVAFSGGCDSLCLLVLCAKVLGKDKVVPVYVNHNLRPESELGKEIRLNETNCARLGIPLIVRTLDRGTVDALAAQRGGGVEDAARALRYEILEQERVRAGASFILTAHHMQDQVETMVMRLRKGSPATSLSGILPVDSRRRVARPLLAFSRDELEHYLVSEGFEWSTDSTNTDARFDRNNVRNTVIPAIRDIWPDCERVLLSLGDNVRGMQPEEAEEAGDSVQLSAFEGLDCMERLAILFSMWDGLFTDRDLPMTFADRVLRALEKGDDCSVGSNGAIFTIYHGNLYLTDPSQDAIFSSFEAPLPAEEGALELPGGMVLRRCDRPADPDSDETGLLRLDPSLLKGKATVRFVRTGDSIRLKGGAKSALRLLQDMGVPAVLRHRVPVIEDEEGLCAVFGSAFGGRDRICVKLRTSIARNVFPLYIVLKG